MIKIIKITFYFIAFLGLGLTANSLLRSENTLALISSDDVASLNPGWQKRAQKILGHKTITQTTSDTEWTHFWKDIEKLFPNLHKTLIVDFFGKNTALYYWRGSKPVLKPIVLMAHADVVPVEYGKWSFDPFPSIPLLPNDSYLRGRGIIDNKGNLSAILESIESLVLSEFIPKRDIYLVFGHDEEVGGNKGAKQVAQYFKKRKIEPYIVVDEGSFVLKKGTLPLRHAVAPIGVAEKGNLNLKLEVTTEGGHSSIPPDDSAISILSQAIVDLKNNPISRPENGNQFLYDFLVYTKPVATFPEKIVLDNLWFFGWPLTQFIKSPKLSAMIRTTMAPTIIQSGIKENIMPSMGHALINFRIHPMDSVKKVREHVSKIISDPKIKISTVGHPKEPSKISKIGKQFEELAGSIKRNFPNAVIAPSLVVAGTDSRHFHEISEHVYKFSPFELDSKAIAQIHGVDERMPIDSYKKAIRFYQNLIHSLQPKISSEKYAAGSHR